jgi:hypothetical protein
VHKGNLAVTMNRDGTAGGPNLGHTELLLVKSMMKKLVPTVTKEYNPYVP